MKNQMYLSILLVAFFLSNAFADEKIKIGVTFNYTASGFFSPEVDGLITDKVISKSPADKAGLKVGDRVLSIQGCKIPGCSASKAKEYLKSKSGTLLHLIVENPSDGIRKIIITVG